MSRHTPLIFAIASVFVTAQLACNDDDSQTGTAPTNNVGPGPTGPGSGGAGATGGSTGNGGSTGGMGPTDTIEDTTCETPAATGVEVYAAAAGMQMDSLASVGSRWIASGPDGFVFFDRNGSNADATASTLLSAHNRIVSEGATAGVGAADQTRTQFQRYDENGAQASATATAAFVHAPSISLAHAGGDTHVSWADNTKIFTRRFTTTGWATDAVEAAATAFNTTVDVVSASGSATEVAVAWSHDQGLDQTRTDVVVVNGTQVGTMHTVTTTTGKHAVAGMAATDSGYALLLTGEAPANEAYLALLDGSGAVTSLLLLEGTQKAYGIASLGDSLAVIAGRASGEVEMRSLQPNGTPRASWVCLGTPDAVVPAAISADGSGYATLFTTSAGAVMLHRTDDLGTGTP